MQARKIGSALGAGFLLALYLGPAAMAAYNAPASYGPLTGDCTTPSSTNPATTCSKYNGGTSFGSMAGQSASAVAITGGSISGVAQTTRTITAAGAITLTTSDFFVCINKTTGAASAVAGEASPVVGTVHVLKDCKGDAATNNITFTPNSGTVDGAANYVMNQNYQAVNIIYTTGGWNLF